MKRFLSTCLITFMVLSAFPGRGMASQTPVATPDPFTLPINLLIVRIAEGNGFAYMTDASGAPSYQNRYVVNDGKVLHDIPTALRTWYSMHNVQDLYMAVARVAPENQVTESNEIGVLIDVRVATFPDSGAAAGLVDDTFRFLSEQAQQDRDGVRDVTPIADLPAHGEAITGMTGTQAHAGRQVPFTRIIAQHGTMVASVKIASLDEAFNDAVAREILSAQLACLSADTFCVPIQVPADADFTPGTPMASPVAVTAVPAERHRNAFKRQAGGEQLVCAPPAEQSRR